MVKLQGVTDEIVRRIYAQIWVEEGTGEMSTDDLFDRDQAVFEASKQEVMDAIRKLEGIGANLELMDEETVYLYQSALSELYKIVENMSEAPLQQDIAV